MINYENFEVEDFLHDDFFIGSVLQANDASDIFWQEWVLKFPDRKNIVDRARVILSSIGTQPIPHELSETEVREIIGHVQEFGYKNPVHIHQFAGRRIAVWVRVAAILLAFLTAGIVLYLNRHKAGAINSTASLSDNLQEYKNLTRQSKLIRMIDGSLAILKPNSSLRFPKTFTAATRNVYLVGEAFFEVRKNPEKPFLVHSGNMITKVLGTSFTVRAFANNNDFSVVVNTGKVVVYDQRMESTAGHTVVLLPHQKVTLNRGQDLLLKDTVSVPMMLAKETASKEFTFTNALLSDVIAKLEMAYHVDITYDDQLGNSTITASLSNLPLDEKIKLICKAINAQCDFKDGQIEIEKRQDN